MKRTYHRTLLHRNLEEAKVILEIMDGFKWDENSKLEKELNYKGLTSWDIIEGGEEAEAIEKEGTIYDENHEYLILNFKNGNKEVFRNSYVAMFIL